MPLAGFLGLVFADIQVRGEEFQLPNPRPADADGAPAPDEPSARARPQPWLEIAAPADDAVIRQIVPLIEVKGRAGLGGIVPHDVVLAIDFSTSTLWPTTLDVDGDGIVGELLRFNVPHPRYWTTDFDDTIVRAEVKAAEHLMQRLDPATTRAGLVTFTERSRLRAPVGPPAEILELLPKLREPTPMASTSIARAIERALQALDEAPPVGADRQRTILILSDGIPTTPPPREKAERLTLGAADAARRAGVRVHAFALGPEAIRETGVYQEVAQRTGGRFVAVENPGEVMHYLPYVSLSGLEGVRVRNLTTDSPGQALRVFPDGSFDTHVRLDPGENRLRVQAQMEDGREVQATRKVFFDPPETPAPADLEAAEALRVKLDLRTVETDLAVRVRERRGGQDRVLTMTGEEE